MKTGRTRGRIIKHQTPPSEWTQTGSDMSSVILQSLTLADVLWCFIYFFPYCGPPSTPCWAREGRQLFGVSVFADYFKQKWGLDTPWFIFRVLGRIYSNVSFSVHTNGNRCVVDWNPTSGALLFVACHILVLLSRFFFCAFHVPSCKGALKRYKISYFLALDVKSSWCLLAIKKY